MKIEQRVEVITDTNFSGKQTPQVGTIIEVQPSIIRDGENVKVRFPNGAEQWFWPGEYKPVAE